MSIKPSSVWPVNELNEIVVQAGAGTTTVTGYVPTHTVAMDESTNKVVFKLPDLDAIVLAEPITGFVSGDGTVGAADTVLQAINKLNGNQVLDATAIALKANAANSNLTGFTTTEARQLHVREVTAAGDITVAASDDVILVNKTVGAATIVTLATGTTGRILTIKDKKNDAAAAANNITITPTAQTIDGAATLVMSTNRQAVRIIFNGTDWSVI